jgi:predicted DNA-binding transcriptional regulator YafY
MSFIEHLHLLRRLDQLIRRKATGTPQAFARQLCVSRASLYRHLDLLAELGASVAYCRLRQTFHYEEEGKLYLAFVPQGEGETS